MNPIKTLICLLCVGTQAASISVDFSRSTAAGPDQAGFEVFAFDGTATHVEFYGFADATDGSLEVTISNNTHYRDYTPITGGAFVGQSDLLSDMVLRNTNGTMNLTLSDLQAGIYDITLYHHSTQFGNGTFSVRLTDSLLTNELKFTGTTSAGTSPAAITTASFQLTANGTDDVVIAMTGGSNSQHLSLNGFDLSTAGPDTDPPTPDPPTFALAPTASGQSVVVMQASIASDPSDVQYYFAETSGYPGGSDSGWQDSPFYMDSGLPPSTPYRYTLQVRDKSPAQNSTAVSAPVLVRTHSFAVDFSRSTAPGPDQAGFNGFAHDGTSTRTESYASSIASDGTVEVTIAGSTHYRDYAAISSGLYTSLSDLLSDMSLRNANGTMTLTLGDLSPGAYSITLYHHSSQFGHGSFTVHLTDAVVSNDLKFSGTASHGTSPTSITAVTFPFTSNGGNVVISMAGGSSGQHLTLNGFALTKPFVGTVVRLG